MVFDVNEMLAKRKHDYKWKEEGYQYTANPNVVGSVVEHLERKNGRATSKDFLEFSKEEDSPTHNMFDWNDERCAEKYRLQMSKNVINSLRVVVQIENPKTNVSEPKVVSAFVRVNDTSPSKTAEYMNIQDAMSNEDTRKHVLNRMYNDMRTFANRYEMYNEAAGVISAINKALEEKEDK